MAKTEHVQSPAPFSTWFGIVLLFVLFGAIVLAVIGPALTFLGFSAYWERAIEGGIILAAVSMDAVRVRSGKHADIVSAQQA